MDQMTIVVYGATGLLLLSVRNSASAYQRRLALVSVRVKAKRERVVDFGLTESCHLSAKGWKGPLIRGGVRKDGRKNPSCDGCDASDSGLCNTASRSTCSNRPKTPHHPLALRAHAAVRPRSAEAAAKGVAKRALIGAAAGAVFGASSAVMRAILGSSEDGEEVIAAGATGGAVIGAAAGAVDGATNGDPVWQEITIRRLLQDLCRCQEPQRAGPDTTRIASVSVGATVDGRQ